MKKTVLYPFILIFLFLSGTAQAGNFAHCLPDTAEQATQAFDRSVQEYPDYDKEDFRHMMCCNDIQRILSLLSGRLFPESKDMTWQQSLGWQHHLAYVYLKPLLQIIQYPDQEQSITLQSGITAPFTLQEQHIIALGLRAIKYMACDFDAVYIKRLLNTDDVTHFINYNLYNDRD